MPERIAFYFYRLYSLNKNLSEGDQKFFSSECSILDSAADIVKQNVNGFVTSVHAETWKNFDDFEGKMIEQSFYSIADNELETSSSADKQRVYDQIIAMWKSNPIKTL